MQQSAMFLFLLAAAVAASQTPTPPQPQQVWQMQDSGSTASLRGIDSVDGTVAWASGTEGTVLKTTDGGAHWQKCAVPDTDKDGATLDFRGVQAWDGATAIVMASGPGDKSRLYKTTDGCKSWTLAFRNPDKDGFWDAVWIAGAKTALMIGDPIPHKELDRFKVRQFFHFPLYGSIDAGDTWNRLDKNDLFALSDNKDKPTQSIFAASNSSLLEIAGHRLILFATGGARVSLGIFESFDQPVPLLCKSRCTMASSTGIPLRSGPTSGAFSIAVKDGDSTVPRIVVVGGDYASPENREGTAAACSREVKDPPFMAHFKCEASTTPPHGYRSTVQWSESEKLWITAGTNGSDLSRDDGRTWQPLDNGNWNALSLPFIVGPKGRIARLNPAAIPKP
jgi:hypothetical protein